MVYESEVIFTSPRTGRPTDDPKRNDTRIRMTDEDVRILEYCAKKQGKAKVISYVRELERFMPN